MSAHLADAEARRRRIAALREGVALSASKVNETHSAETSAWERAELSTKVLPEF